MMMVMMVMVMVIPKPQARPDSPFRTAPLWRHHECTPTPTLIDHFLFCYCCYFFLPFILLLPLAHHHHPLLFFLDVLALNGWWSVLRQLASPDGGTALPGAGGTSQGHSSVFTSFSTAPF